MANIIVVDGANVAYGEKTNDGKPKVSNLTRMRDALLEENFEPLFVVDASLIYEVDDRQQLEKLLDKQAVRQAPAGTDADFFVLETADHYRCLVVSNDRYEHYRDQFPWIDQRRVPFMIINGRVELYRPQLDQAK